jgi:DNA repair exonuclease SbcCD nuclease subunit
MSVRFLHGADFHLDSPFDGLDARRAVERRREQRELLKKIPELCRREGAQLLLLSGDLLDSASTYTETIETLWEVFSSLSIPVFIAPGNHDCVTGQSPYMRLALPDHVHIFRNNHIECVSLPELGVRVWGAGYTDTICPPLLTGFEAAKDGDILDIMVLHGEVGRPASTYCPITEEELRRSGMDYVALGHNHRFSGLRRSGDCFYAWPGCVEGRGFDECGEKGVILGELSPGECHIDFVPMGGRRYESITIPVGTDPLAAAMAALPADTTRDVYRLVFTGETDGDLNLSTLANSLESRFYSLTLVDRTVPRRDIWSRVGENTLHGYFLQRMQQRLNQADNEEEREAILRSVRWAMAALDGREEPG